MSAPKATKRAAPTTSIATHTNDDIYIRDKSLCSELIGKLSFTEMIVFQMLGRMPSAAETAMIDACLVTLMEHGLTPSALATRLIYSSAPEAMQAGVAAGLMGVGSVFVGTMEGNAQLLLEIVEDPAGIEAAATRVAQEHRAARKPLPGFGHHLHKPDDPRPIRLFQLAEEHGQSGTYIAALKALSAAIHAVSSSSTRPAMRAADNRPCDHPPFAGQCPPISRIPRCSMPRWMMRSIRTVL
ncbi:citryl-CoA lyase [Thalassobaculum salexigens]|uniref:citryl-CoA lyase n=1 Tax=Thalassobaculum salexigens TaxID=455360 RepID=UPI00248F2A5C|nr:citryl-CoA lyase [Thalassobaculum salexigens]